MTVEGQSISDEGAVLNLTYQFDGKDPGYPFHPFVRLQYTLSVSGFEIHIHVTNMNPTKPMLFYVGWHPYFQSSVYQTRITLDRHCNKWAAVTLNDHLIPTGITHLFNGFVGNDEIGGTYTTPKYYDKSLKAVGTYPDSAECFPNEILYTRLYDSETRQTVVLYHYKNKFPIVHVLTGIVSATGEQAVAIEPMSAMADSFNNHDNLQILSGGEIWSGAFGVYLQ